MGVAAFGGCNITRMHYTYLPRGMADRSVSVAWRGGGAGGVCAQAAEQGGAAGEGGVDDRAPRLLPFDDPPAERPIGERAACGEADVQPMYIVTDRRIGSSSCRLPQTSSSNC